MGDELTGIGRYISELCKELDQLMPGAEFFLYAPWPFQMPLESPRWKARIDPLGKLFERLRRSWVTKHAWMLLRAGALSMRDKVNVFWATDAPFIPRVPKSVKVVATVHDFHYLVVPEVVRRTTRYGRLMLEGRFRRADVLLTNSEATATKLQRFLGYQAKGVARPAVSSHFRRRDEAEIQTILGRYRVQRPYLLSVASCDPHKNLVTLIIAFLELKANSRLNGYSLVLVGKRGERLVAELANAMGSDLRKVRALGYVPDHDLPGLYSGAEALVFPSLDEGFGMPVLEARACQTKIVTTDAPELREAGGDRAIYVQPNREGIRSGILTALAAERRTDPDKLWTWKSSAEIVASAIEAS